MIGQQPDMEQINGFFGRMAVLMDVHGHIIERLGGLLPSETHSGDEP
jgi:hypothetical protein